jgi:hypothetical protein
MKAYEVKQGTKVIIIDEKVKTPPSSIPVNNGDVITINRLDGMYCNGINKDGNRVYIAAWTNLKIL